MARNSTAPQWIVAGLLTLAIAAAAWTSFSSTGLHLESSGVKMVMKASLDHGLTIKFATVG